MSKKLASCPKCRRADLTPEELKAHKCSKAPKNILVRNDGSWVPTPAPEPAAKGKASKPVAAEVTTEAPQDPAWQPIRETIATVRAAGRAYLFGQAWLGWQLSVRKAEHQKAGGGRGGDRKSTGQVGRLIPWAEVVQQECGLSERTANRFIQMFDATKAKLKRTAKKIPSNGTALAILQSENPLALPPEQREAVQDVISSLCDGETQVSLMQELGVVPKPKPMPKKKGDAEEEEEEETESPEETAFHFFDGPASAIVNARASADYKKLLHMLPVTASKPGKVSVTFLRDEAAALLEDCNEVLAALAKPARTSKA